VSDSWFPPEDDEQEMRERMKVYEDRIKGRTEWARKLRGTIGGDAAVVKDLNRFSVCSVACSVVSVG